MTAFLRAAAVLLIGVLVSTATFAGTNVWTNSGPPGGSPRQLRASPTEANVFYASFSSGMYRSTDGGVTWNTLREFESLVSGFAIDPSDGNRIYVAVYDDGIYRSNDGGQTFNLIEPVSTGVWTLGVSGATVYYATNAQSFYRSTDHGQTWTERTATPEVLFRMLIDANDPNIVYAYTMSSNKLFRSADGGNSWTSATVDSRSPVTVMDLAQLSTTQLIAATRWGTFISNDSGANWTQTYNSSGVTRWIALAAVRSTPARAFAVLGETLAQTTDFGATWNTLGTAPIGLILNLALDAQSPARMVVTGGGGTAYSTDGGATWSEATQQPIASSPSELVTTVANNSKIYTYSQASESVFSTSGDSGWQRIDMDAVTNSGANPLSSPRIAVRTGAPNTVYITPQASWPAVSEDGGNSWSQPAGYDRTGFDPVAFAFDKDDTNIIYAAVKTRFAMPAASVYRSLDGGATWVPYSSNLYPAGRDLQIDPVNGSRMFLAGSVDIALTGGGLWRSIDRGVNWNQVALGGEDVRNVAINPATPARIYASAQSGLYVTSNGGDSFAANDSFAAATGNRAATSVQVDPAVPSTVYAISQSVATASGQGLTSSSHVLRSVDDGQTWEILRDATATPRWAVTDLAIDPNNPSLIYVTTGGHGVGTLRIAPDLAVTIAGHSGTRPRNEEASFTLQAVNNGPYAATGVVFTAQLPEGLTNVSASPDHGNCTTAAVITCDTSVLRAGEAVNVVVNYTPTKQMAIPVTASIAAHESDGAAGNNSVAAAVQTDGEFANLRVTLQPSVTSLTRGGNLTYSVTVTNDGPLTANAGTLTFTPGSGISLGTLPNGCSTSGAAVSCSLASMAASASRSFAFPATVTQAGSITATATVEIAAPILDSDPTNNDATAAITASEPPPSGGGSGAGGGGGGGGAFNLAALLAMLIASILRHRLTHCRMLAFQKPIT